MAPVMTHLVFNNVKDHVTDEEAGAQRPDVVCPSGRPAFEYSAVHFTTYVNWTGDSSFI